MSEFYTNVTAYGNNLYHRFINQAGERIIEKVAYSPCLYVASKDSQCGWKTLHGQDVLRQSFPTIKDYKNYLQYPNEHGVYGDISPSYQFINDRYNSSMVQQDFVLTDEKYRQLIVANLDIETESESGFPDPSRADQPILSITIFFRGEGFNQRRKVVFLNQSKGYGDYNNQSTEVKVYKFDDEVEMLHRFLELWDNVKPDIMTGWAITWFDIPYIVNRMKFFNFEERDIKKLSPIRKMYSKIDSTNGQDREVWNIGGIANLDYMECYKNQTFIPQNRESYRLDFIANLELGESKISNTYGSYRQFYKQDWQKFIEYNIQDVNLVERLDDKLGLIRLIVSLSYVAMCNYEDVFFQVRLWDCLCYNRLYAKKIVVPKKRVGEKNKQFIGAFVKEPKKGFHDWVVSLDVNSLYPNIIIQQNISPETIVDVNSVPGYDSIRNLSDNDCLEKMIAGDLNTDAFADYSFTPNKQFFLRNKTGFLPDILKNLYEGRKAKKKLSNQYAKQAQEETNEQKKRELLDQAKLYDVEQQSLKITLNSAYGALGSPYFRFYDTRLAEAVTTTGQFTIRYMHDHINRELNRMIQTDGIDFVIASDTDSLILNCGKIVEKVLKTETDKRKIANGLSKIFEKIIIPDVVDVGLKKLCAYTHGLEWRLRMSREIIADRGIWTAKKRYMLNVLDKEGIAKDPPSLKIMGIETARSSTPKFIREKLKDSIRVILNESEKSLQKFTQQVRNEFEHLKPEEIAFPRGLNGLEKYSLNDGKYASGTPIHVRGAILYNHLLEQKGVLDKYEKLNDGEKLKFLYLKMPNPIRENVIAFSNELPSELGLNAYIDFAKQFEKTFLDPLKHIVEVINWSFERKATLDV